MMALFVTIIRRRVYTTLDIAAHMSIQRFGVCLAMVERGAELNEVVQVGSQDGFVVEQDFPARGAPSKGCALACL